MKSLVCIFILTLNLCSGNTLQDGDSRRAPRLTIPRGGGIFSRGEAKERRDNTSFTLTPTTPEKRGRFSRIFSRKKERSNNNDDKDNVFSRATTALESSVVMTDETKQRARDLMENSADRMAAQALRVARAEQANLEKLILDYRQEVENAAQNTTSEIQKMALQKAALAEEVARQRAMELSASVEEMAREKLQVVQDSILQRAYELDEKVTNLITTGSMDKPKPPVVKFFYENAQLVDGVSVALVLFGVFASLCNLFGKHGPDYAVWERTHLLGDLTVRNKQFLAGAVELASVLLMVMSGQLRKVGAGILAALYAHGVVVADGIAVGLATITALFVFIADVVVSLYYDNY